MYKKMFPVMVLVLLLSLVLAACGDSPTATVAPTATSAPTTTVAPTATTAPATTVAATTTARPVATTQSGSSSIFGYPGAVVMTMPDNFKNQIISSMGSGIKNGQVEVYKTADDATKIKTSYTDALKKDGWNDQTATLGATANESMERVGGFVLIFQKGLSAAAVMVLPATAGAAFGLSGLDPKESLIMIIRGEANLGASTTTRPATTAASSGDTDIPQYPGSTAVQVPNALATQVISSMGSRVNNAKVEAFKSSDSIETIKELYEAGAKSNGWNDMSALATGNNTNNFATMGGFFLIIQKAKKVVGIIGLPGSIAGPMGFSGVTAADSLIILISGEG
jgi:hypothetical protein